MTRRSRCHRLSDRPDHAHIVHRLRPHGITMAFYDNLNHLHERANPPGYRRATCVFWTMPEQRKFPPLTFESLTRKDFPDTTASSCHEWRNDITSLAQQTTEELSTAFYMHCSVRTEPYTTVDRVVQLMSPFLLFTSFFFFFLEIDISLFYVSCSPEIHFERQQTLRQACPLQSL